MLRYMFRVHVRNLIVTGNKLVSQFALWFRFSKVPEIVFVLIRVIHLMYQYVLDLHITNYCIMQGNVSSELNMYISCNMN
jgi:hypothetical protein